MLNSFLYAFEKGILSIEQRRAILALLPKGDKDTRYLKNWRPLSLLNTDYKILTKTLAVRLQHVIPKIIDTDQTGCVKGRFIGENSRILLDVLQQAGNGMVEGIVAFLDFEKAFDSVSWDFLLATLKKFNFGPCFQQWIKTIYTLPECAVTNNGYSSQFFTLSRGIRQGCPISALLFIIVAEVMAINIRNDCKIEPINFGDSSLKIRQYADDTVLFLKDHKSLKCTFDLLDRFQLSAGLKLNKDKTEAILLCNRPLNVNEKHLGIKWVTEETKSLGIWVGKDSQKKRCDNS